MKYDTCKKKTRFESRQEAAIRATEINLGEESIGSKVRLRAYECPFCDGYHLTSIPKDKFNKWMEGFKKREKRFIRLEADYWEKKLGIDND